MTSELTVSSAKASVDNSVLQPEGVDCIPVVVDLISLKLLKGERLV